MSDTAKDVWMQFGKYALTAIIAAVVMSLFSNPSSNGGTTISEIRYEMTRTQLDSIFAAGLRMGADNVIELKKILNEVDMNNKDARLFYTDWLLFRKGK
jgi:hypothetical protein